MSIPIFHKHRMHSSYNNRLRIKTMSDAYSDDSNLDAQNSAGQVRKIISTPYSTNSKQSVRHGLKETPKDRSNSNSDQYADDFDSDQGNGNTDNRQDRPNQHTDKNNSLELLVKQRHSLSLLEQAKPKSKNNESAYRSNANKKLPQIYSTSNQQHQLKIRSRTINQKSSVNQHYLQEMDRKIGAMVVTQATSDHLIGVYNERIRTLIKKLNDQLNGIIDKNLHDFMRRKNSLRKDADAEDTIKLLQQELRNNNKIEHRLEAELKGIQQQTNMIQSRDQENGFVDQVMEVEDINKKIRELIKTIHLLRLEIKSEDKKAEPDEASSIRDEGNCKPSRSFALLKLNIATLQKQHDSNEQRIFTLTKREKELVHNIDKFGDKDKKADEWKMWQRKLQKKLTRLQELRNKHQALQKHKGKVHSLWKGKATLVAHENESLRQNLRNVESEIKNAEQSTTQLYSKAKGLLTEGRTIRKINASSYLSLSDLESIVEEMKVYDGEHLSMPQRDRSESQLRKGFQDARRATSTVPTHNRNTHKADLQIRKGVKINRTIDAEKDEQIESKQGSRIWNQQHHKHITNSEQNDRNLKIEQKEEENKEVTGKNKVFSLMKKRKNAQDSINEQSQWQVLKQPDLTQQQNSDQTEQLTVPLPTLQKKTQIEQKGQEKPTTIPKRFSLFRKKQETEIQGSIEHKSNEEENCQTNADATQNGETATEQHAPSRPMFKLKRKSPQNE